MDDMQMKPWKILAIFPLKVDVPQVGQISTAALDVEIFWDIQRKHASYASEPANGRRYYINAQAPPEYHDDTRYATPAGLNMIMR
jgi:hypothetical protein